MISQNLQEFYSNWNSKIDLINEDDKLSTIYDNFITYFIIYNNLYNEVTIHLKNNNYKIPKKIYDSIAATTYVVDYLNAEPLLEKLEQNNNDDILSLIDILENEVFYIKLNYGKPQRDKDLIILKNLKSNNKKEKCIAIMQILYNVRCNLFHGSKDFKEYQRLILDPLNNIIKTVNELLYNELTK